MHRTIEAIIHPDGTVEPIEALESPILRRAADHPRQTAGCGGRPARWRGRSRIDVILGIAELLVISEKSRKSSSRYPKRSELRSHAVSHRERRRPGVS